jgi:hypothetical protein
MRERINLSIILKSQIGSQLWKTWTPVDINKGVETVRENIKISAKRSLGYYELRKHKPWLNEGCSELLDQRKQAKLQRLQDPSEINEDNLNNRKRETGRHFRKIRGNV